MYVNVVNLWFYCLIFFSVRLRACSTTWSHNVHTRMATLRRRLDTQACASRVDGRRCVSETSLKQHDLFEFLIDFDDQSADEMSRKAMHDCRTIVEVSTRLHRFTDWSPTLRPNYRTNLD